MTRSQQTDSSYFQHPRNLYSRGSIRARTLQQIRPHRSHVSTMHDEPNFSFPNANFSKAAVVICRLSLTPTATAPPPLPLFHPPSARDHCQDQPRKLHEHQNSRGEPESLSLLVSLSSNRPSSWLLGPLSTGIFRRIELDLRCPGSDATPLMEIQSYPALAARYPITGANGALANDFRVSNVGLD